MLSRALASHSAARRHPHLPFRDSPRRRILPPVFSDSSNRIPHVLKLAMRTKFFARCPFNKLGPKVRSVNQHRHCSRLPAKSEGERQWIYEQVSENWRRERLPSRAFSMVGSGDAHPQVATAKKPTPFHHGRGCILFLSIHEQTSTFLPRCSVGASGYVTKRRLVKDLVTAIREVIQGNVFLSQSLRK